jgi:hypothetical protein
MMDPTTSKHTFCGGNAYRVLSYLSDHRVCPRSEPSGSFLAAHRRTVRPLHQLFAYWSLVRKRAAAPSMT